MSRLMNWIQRKVYERCGLPSPETIEQVQKARLDRAEYVQKLVSTARVLHDQDSQRFNAARGRRDVD